MWLHPHRIEHVPSTGPRANSTLRTYDPPVIFGPDPEKRASVSRTVSNLSIRLRQVHARVEGLLKDRDHHAKAHLGLQEELRELKRSDEVLRARIMELEQENEVLRAVKATPQDKSGVAGDRTGSKERIDELVIEIDRCLALLNN